MNQFQALFPVTLTSTWQPGKELALDATLRDWLFDAGSLTARLRERCQHFRVELLGQAIASCTAEEAHGSIQADEPVLVREVLLYCDDRAQVFARSLLPLSSLTGAQQQLANLGTQPLGQVLFNDPLLRRESIEVARFGRDSSVGLLASLLHMPQQHDLWGRRSLFIVQDKPIMVAEVFLPDAFAYRHRDSELNVTPQNHHPAMQR